MNFTWNGRGVFDNSNGNLSVYFYIDAHSIFRCFRGIFATLNLNKNINCYIKIMPNNALISEGDQKINLDSSKFEEYFGCIYR